MKQIGNNFFIRLVIDAAERFIVCEQNSGLDLAAEIITVLCKTTGQWAEILPGGTKSGSLSFTGAYEKDPTGDNLSAFELIPLLGTVQDVIYGGLEPSDDIVEVPVHISNVNITADTNAAITFTATLTVAGEPTVTKVGT
jgi:hypothetical protein